MKIGKVKANRPSGRDVSKYKKKRLKEDLSSYVFLLPWLFFLLVFTLYPFCYGIGISLFDFTLKKQEFIGFGNYVALFQDQGFLNSIVVTFKFVIIIIPGTILASLLIAYAIRGTSKWFQSCVKVVFYLTSIVSQVALIMVWKWMFSPSYGMYASLANWLNVQVVDLFGNATYSIPLLSILVMSFTVSQPIVLISAAMDGVPATLYEAASLDGASRFTQFRKITIPGIRSTLLFITVTTTINNLQVFVVPYLMTGGGPNGQTTPVLLLIYQNAFEYGKYGYASAMGVVLFVLIAFLVAVQFKMQQAKND